MLLNIKKWLFLLLIFLIFSTDIFSQETDSGFKSTKIDFINGSGFEKKIDTSTSPATPYLQALSEIQLSNGMLADNLRETQITFLQDKLAGSIMGFSGPQAQIPTGWLVCDGREVPTSDYPVLYNRMGDTWGAPSNEFVFKLPDLRGYFLRGVALSGGNPGDPASGNARAVGSLQTYESRIPSGVYASTSGVAPSHQHGYWDATMAVHSSQSTSLSPVTTRLGVSATLTQTSGEYLNTKVLFFANKNGSNISSLLRIWFTVLTTAPDSFTHAHTAPNIADPYYVETRPNNYPVIYCIKY